MRRVMREKARLELERRVRAYRRARVHPRPPEGWLRAMRLAVGIPAQQIAESVGFTAKMVFQMERAEQKRRISLQRLEEMARALGCDLVYGLVPWERSLEDRALELVEREAVEEEVYRTTPVIRDQGSGIRDQGSGSRKAASSCWLRSVALGALLICTSDGRTMDHDKGKARRRVNVAERGVDKAE